MEKSLFEKDFIDRLNKNFEKKSKYFEAKFDVFKELEGLVFEINKCLILELDRASITLTNHMLERLLKIALIYNETGIGAKPVEEWNSIFEEPNKKYNSIQLGNSIELCKKHGLISENQKSFLFKIIRTLMRNGFSHADSSEILSDLPDDSLMFQSSFDKPSDINNVFINQKLIPIMQSIQLEYFAKDNSLMYFDYVFNLILEIEKKLADKQN